MEAWCVRTLGRQSSRPTAAGAGAASTVVPDAAAARPPRRTMSRPPPLHRAIKRLVAERDPWALRAALHRTRPVVSVQPLVEGRPANSAVACHEGTTLAAVHVEVAESVGPTGPATLVRLVKRRHGLRREVGRLRVRLSGLCGLDFIALDAGGTAHLLELNPRATPTAHLVGPDGADPLSALRASARARAPLPRRARRPADLVVSLRPPAARGPDRAACTHFWLPSRRLPLVSVASGEGGGSTDHDHQGES